MPKVLRGSSRFFPTTLFSDAARTRRVSPVAKLLALATFLVTGSALAQTDFVSLDENTPGAYLCSRDDTGCVSQGAGGSLDPRELVFTTSGNGPIYVRAGFCDGAPSTDDPAVCNIVRTNINRARAFSSRKPWLGWPNGFANTDSQLDWDLGSPNMTCLGVVDPAAEADVPLPPMFDCPGTRSKQCPGGGQGNPNDPAEGGPSSPAPNCKPLDNVFIVQEWGSLAPTTPQNDARGFPSGQPRAQNQYLELDLEEITAEVTVYSFELIDIELDEQRPSIDFFAPGATVPFRTVTPIEEVGNNGALVYFFDPPVPDVGRLLFRLRGSGAIDGIVLGVDDGDPDLALRKRPAVEPPPVYRVGDSVTFNIEIFNQGTTAADFSNGALEVTDYLANDLAAGNGSEIRALNWEAFDLADNPPGLVTSTNGEGISYSWTSDGRLVADSGILDFGHAFTVPVTLTVATTAVADANDQICNLAEISIEPNWLPPGTDFDSTPDNDPANDLPLEDDQIFEGPPTGDEDDHDIACVPVEIVIPDYDLALFKACQLTPVQQGQGGVFPLEDVTLRLRLENQGAINGVMSDATDVEIIDYLDSAAYTFDPAKNPGGTTSGDVAVPYSWDLSGPFPVVTVEGTVTAGQAVTLDMVLTATLNPPDPLPNTAEILIDDGDDADSMPEDDQNNGAADLGVEDDIGQALCPLATPMFDLALRKRILSQPSAPMPGDAVTFSIEVFNQGNVAAQDITLIDWVNVGHPDYPLTSAWWQPFSVADNPVGTTTGDQSLAYSWSDSGGNGMVTISGTPDTLAPGESLTLPVTLRVAVGSPEILYNFAEIYTDGMLMDMDSAPESEETNGNNDPLIDDVIDDDGTLDEDDHDVAEVRIIDPYAIPTLGSLGLLVLIGALLALGLGRMRP